MNLVTLHQGTGRFMVLALVLLAGMAHGGTELTPQKYVDIRLNALALTVEGIQERLSRLRDDPYDDEDQRRVGQIVQAEVDRVFEDYGITKRAFLAYGADHEAEVEAWLEQNPELARQLSQLKERRSSLSKQIKALKEE